jgi:Arc/MetJ-type ribon-helix-helix transcriptional regulator
MGADVRIVGGVGKVVGAKLPRNEIDQINKLVESGFYLNSSDFIREAVREVAGYFQMKGEAYASDASTDLQLDYELVCKIMDDLEKEGKMETIE